LKKEAFEQLKKELLIIGMVFAASLTAFKIIFFRESFFVVLRAVFAVFWLLILPGFFIMLYWHEELKFFERLIIGIAAGTSIIGLASYYFGLMGLNIRYHTILLPSIMIAAGLVMTLNKKYSQHAEN
jgi:hypothetical protein